MLLQVETAIEGVAEVYEAGGIVAVLVVVPIVFVIVALIVLWKWTEKFQKLLIEQSEKVPEILKFVEAVHEQNDLAKKLEAQLSSLHSYYGDKISTLQEKRNSEMKEIVREVIDTMHATKAAAERSSSALEAVLLVIRERELRRPRTQRSTHGGG